MNKEPLTIPVQTLDQAQEDLAATASSVLAAPVPPPAERVHHPYSPSKLQYLECCPAYENRDTVSEAATTGTKQHAVTESGIDDNTLGDEEAAAAAECMDFFERQKRLLVEERAREVNRMVLDQWGKHVSEGEDPECVRFAEAIIPQVVEFKEVYLPIDDEKIQAKSSDPIFVGTTAGYLDCGLISYDGTRAVLADWKFGAWAVEETKNNLQGIAYALGVFRAWPTVETVDFYFKQPKIDALSHAQWKRSDVPALYLRVCTVVARAVEARRLGNFSTANATVPGCNFCANIARCPKVAELVISIGKKFYPLALPADLDAHSLSDPAQMAVGKRLASIVETWASAFNRALNDRVLRGEAPLPEGYKLTSSQRREIVDEKIFRDIALRHLTEQEWYDSLELQFGRVEKAVSAKAPRGGKTAALESFKTALIEEGAVKMGEPFAFLKVDSSK